MPSVAEELAALRARSITKSHASKLQDANGLSTPEQEAQNLRVSSQKTRISTYKKEAVQALNAGSKAVDQDLDFKRQQIAKKKEDMQKQREAAQQNYAGSKAVDKHLDFEVQQIAKKRESFQKHKEAIQTNNAGTKAVDKQLDFAVQKIAEKKEDKEKQKEASKHLQSFNEAKRRASLVKMDSKNSLQSFVPSKEEPTTPKQDSGSTPTSESESEPTAKPENVSDATKTEATEPEITETKAENTTTNPPPASMPAPLKTENVESKPEAASAAPIAPAPVPAPAPAQTKPAEPKSEVAKSNPAGKESLPAASVENKVDVPTVEDVPEIPDISETPNEPPASEPEPVQHSDVPGQRIQNRAEKKVRKMMQKLGLKPVPGISRATLKMGGRQGFFTIQSPDVFEKNGSYIIFGEARQGAGPQQAREQQAQAVQQLATPVPQPKVEPVVDDDNSAVVDETGVEAKDIDLVVSQAGCSRAQAVKALKDNGGDLVNAIMSITN